MHTTLFPALSPTASDDFGDAGAAALPRVSPVLDDLRAERARHLLAAAAVDDQLVNLGDETAFKGDPIAVGRSLLAQLAHLDRAAADLASLALLNGCDADGRPLHPDPFE